MFNNKCLNISFCCIVFFKLSGQTISSKIDTFKLNDTLSTITLSKNFLIESSLITTLNGRLEEVTVINNKNSIISLPSVKKNDEVIIKYQYLNNGLPIKIGPKWKDLPKINNSDSLVVEKSLLKKNKIKEDQDLFSSGSVFRKINFSPFGSSDLTGGLQMQINGKLGNDIILSGVLSDQDIPIQPEGVTKELEEIDKVFIAIRHPIFTLDAGDIVYKDSIPSIDIEKKLTGLQNSFSSNKISASSVYGGSKGTFHSKEIYGRDGDQGPYQLKSKTGNKEIIILSGTEKIWLDGKKLVRGEMFDYTINYSSGRVFFTPKNLIHNDMRILFEYQYSDFSYEKSFIGGSFQKKGIRNKSLIGFGVYKESDIYKKIILEDQLNESLSEDDSGVIKRSTVIKDENGDYFLQDSIYVFDYMKNDNLLPRYSIVFNYNPKGNYKKRISNKGKVFYEYITEMDRNTNTDYYSPFDVSYAPRNIQFGYLNGKYSINKYFHVNTQLRSSTKNSNLLKSGLKKTGQAYNLEMRIDSIKVLDNILKFKFNQQIKDDNYYSLGRENDVNKSKLWNLDSLINQGVKEQSFISSLENSSIGKITLDLSSLESKSSYLSRFKMSSYFNQKNIEGSYIDYFKINSNKVHFYRFNSYLQIKSKYLTPYISFIKELEALNEKYFRVEGGFKILSNKWEFESGIEKRVDEKYYNNTFENSSNDLIGMIDYKYKPDNGWSNHLLYKKRIKDVADGIDYNYSLSDINIVYKKPDQLMNFKIQGRKEETFTEARAIIYDSVGVGFGNFRYDKNFNIFIPDQNGSFISYNIYTGEKKQSTLFQGMQDLRINFQNIKKISDFSFHINSRQNISGNLNNLKQLYKYNIDNEKIYFSTFQLRSELIYSKKNNFLIWNEVNYSFFGEDPRGNELNKKISNGITFNRKIYKMLSVKNEFLFSHQLIETNISTQLERKLNSWWEDFELQFRVNRSLDFDLSLFGGFDDGSIKTEKIKVLSHGLSVKAKYLFDKMGSINLQFKFINTDENSNRTYIPPEFGQGYALGKSLILQSRFQYFFTNSISSIITIYGIDDSRYSRSLNFQGELRAYF